VQSLLWAVGVASRMVAIVEVHPLHYVRSDYHAIILLMIPPKPIAFVEQAAVCSVVESMGSSQ